MLLRIAFLVVILASAPLTASAGLIDSYTVIGNGAASSSISGLTDEPFWWIDYTGGAGFLDLESYGFYPAPAVGDPSSAWYGANASGSLLLSSPFDLADGESLTVEMALITEKRDRWNIDGDVGFALLLEEGVLRAVLANSRPDGNLSIYTSLSHPADLWLTPTSPGVTASTTVGDAIEMTLGDGRYGQRLDTSYCVTECIRDITSTFSPGAGSYQLLFGMYNVSGEIDEERRSALLVKSVTVAEPSALAVTVAEPSTLVLLFLATIGLCRLQRRPTAY